MNRLGAIAMLAHLRGTGRSFESFVGSLNPSGLLGLLRITSIEKNRFAPRRVRAAYFFAENANWTARLLLLPVRGRNPSPHQGFALAGKWRLRHHGFAWRFSRDRGQEGPRYKYCTSRRGSYDLYRRVWKAENTGMKFKCLFASVPTELFFGLVTPVLRLPVYRRVTLARGIFQLFPVFDLYFSARVGDQPGLLQHSRGQSHTRAPGTQHVRQELLRQRYDVFANAILAHQQPSSQPFVHLVKPIAGGHLRGLHPHFLRKTLQRFLQRWALGQSSRKFLSADPESAAINLHNHAARTAGKPHE